MPRVVDRERRRAELVTAAAATFAAKGVADTAVSDIVRAAGVAQGTFYLYFDCKEDVILAVAERFGDVLVESIERTVAQPGTAVGKLLALRDVFREATDVDAAADLFEIMHRPGSRVMHDRLTEHLTPRLAAIVERIIAQGVAEGAFAVPDMHTAAWFVLGGLRSAELSGVTLAELSAALAAVTELALRALGYAKSAS
jgi:AcrR family transcriptional regulator